MSKLSFGKGKRVFPDRLIIDGEMYLVTGRDKVYRVKKEGCREEDEEIKKILGEDCDKGRIKKACKVFED